MNVTLRLKGTPTLRLRYQPGLVGPAGTITVGDVTTGAAGTDAEITNSGTSQAAVLDFTIPRGDTGATGATGAAGNDGWTPELAVVTDGTRRVQQVADWFGGDGTKPATGEYVGATGLVSAIGDAVDIRGPAGPATIPDGDKGDVTTSGSGATWTINAGAVGTDEVANDAITFDKTQNIATASLLGRTSAGTGNIEVLPLATLGRHIPHGRLTLESGVPVSQADQTAKTTLYYTPYTGSTIWLYSSGVWGPFNFSERSLSLSGYTTGKPFDIFAYDNAGTVALESLVWTNDTTRATALARQDGVFVKSGDATRLYLGTIYTSATGQCEDSKGKRYVWNAYNRVPRKLYRAEPNASWSYSTDTFRQANASAANQFDMVIGLAEDAVEAEIIVTMSNSVGGAAVRVAFGVDSTTTATAEQLTRYFSTANAGAFYTIGASYRDNPGAGKHSLVWLERASAIGATTWYGVSSGILQSGMIGVVRA